VMTAVEVTNLIVVGVRVAGRLIRTAGPRCAGVATT
jgi:hypothetical protein